MSSKIIICKKKLGLIFAFLCFFNCSITFANYRKISAQDSELGRYVSANRSASSVFHTAAIMGKNGDFILNISVANTDSEDVRRLYEILGYSEKPSLISLNFIGNLEKGIVYQAHGGGISTLQISNRPSIVISGSVDFFDGAGRPNRNDESGKVSIQFENENKADSYNVERRLELGRIFLRNPELAGGLLLDPYQEFVVPSESVVNQLLGNLLSSSIRVKTVSNLRRSVISVLDPVTGEIIHISEPLYRNLNHYPGTHAEGFRAGIEAFKKDIGVYIVSRLEVVHLKDSSKNIVTTPEMFVGGHVNSIYPPHMYIIQITEGRFLVVPNAWSPGSEYAEYSDVLASYLALITKGPMPPQLNNRAFIIDNKNRDFYYLNTIYPSAYEIGEMLGEPERYLEFGRSIKNPYDMFVKNEEIDRQFHSSVDETSCMKFFDF